MHDIPGFDRESYLRGLWGLEDRFVSVIATDTEEDRGSEAHTLLISADGNAWFSAPLPTPDFRVQLGEVIDGALWLVGETSSGASPVWQAWSSTDGIGWRHADGFEPAFEGAESVVGLARSSMGWTVVVETRAPDESPTTRVRHSVDGVTWKTPDLPAVLDEDREVVALATGGSTSVIVLENRDPGAGRGIDVVVSENGSDWTLGPVVQRLVDVNDMTFGAGGYVIVGEFGSGDRSGEPLGWRSGDGWSGSWDEVHMPVGLLPPNLSPVAGHRIIATHRGYLATSQANGMAWTSRDGIGWSAFNVWPSVGDFMTGVAVVGDVVVAGQGTAGRVGFLRGNLAGMVGP